MPEIKTIEITQGPDPYVYYIWSNMHKGWWAVAERGYVPGLEGAGVYTRDQAIDICQRSIPNAAHHGQIATIPVRVEDVNDFMRGQMIPEAIMRGRS